MSKSKTYSFAVGSQYGLRSTRWVASVSDNEVYVSCDHFRDQWHASLHASGRWHIRDHGYDEGEGPTLKHHSETVPNGAFPVGLKLLVPDACLRKAVEPEKLPQPDRWFPRPEPGGYIELWISRTMTGSWPVEERGIEAQAILWIDTERAVMVLARSVAAHDSFARTLNTFLLKEHPPGDSVYSLSNRFIHIHNSRDSITLIESAYD